MKTGAKPEMQKAGGIASLLIAASYVFGFGLFFGFIDRSGYDSPNGDLAFLLDHQGLLALAMIVLYVAAGTALTVLGLAVHRCFAEQSPAVSQLCLAFAMIWAAIVISSGMIGLVGMDAIAGMAADDPDRAAGAWFAISAVQDALGGGIEYVGGIWMLLVSWLMLRSDSFPRGLAWLGFVIGALGLATILPFAREAAALFGLSQIVWFVWFGILLIRNREP